MWHTSLNQTYEFVVQVTNCGTWYANGVYIPQEEKNGLYVYENEYGCLLSVEKASETAKGWVIGRNGIVLYAKSVASRVRDVENELHSLHPRWCVFKVRDVQASRSLRSLSKHLTS